MLTLLSVVVLFLVVYIICLTCAAHSTAKEVNLMINRLSIYDIHSGNRVPIEKVVSELFKNSGLRYESPRKTGGGFKKVGDYT